MSSQLTVKDVYKLYTQPSTSGIEGYHIQKKYCDPLKLIADRQLAKRPKGLKQKITKRGSFIQDELKIKKIIPGPGKYKQQELWPDKAKLKTHVSEKMTYIDEIIKKVKKFKEPAPGHYEITKSLKQQEKIKKQLAVKKISIQDRKTYLDHVLFESNQIPGVGMYNVRRIKTAVSSKSKLKPQQWRKKHFQQSKKKKPKTPDVTTYNPKSMSFTTFDQLTKTNKKNLMNKTDRFKTQKSGSGINPNKYSVIQNWRGKDTKKIQRHGMQVLSRSTMNKSVYYH